MKHLPHTSSEAAIQELKKFIKQTKNHRVRDRARAILSRMQGTSRATLASFLGVHKDTISNWITLYRKKGVSGLLDKPQKGNKYKLSYDQKNHIKHIVLTHTPRQLGFEHDYWDITILEDLIFQLYKIRYISQKSYKRLYIYIGFDKS